MGSRPSLLRSVEGGVFSKLRMITARSRGSHLTDSIEASQETEDSFGLQLRDEALTPDQDLEHADLIHAVRNSSTLSRET